MSPIPPPHSGEKSSYCLATFGRHAPSFEKDLNKTQLTLAAACIKSSPLWPFFTVETLNTPIRNASDPDYAAFLTQVGDRTTSTVNLDMLEKVTTKEELISLVFPPDVLHVPESCLSRAILVPTNKQVDHYNRLIYTALANDSHTC